MDIKYAIMSDAHANPQALEVALGDARKQDCTKLVFLGDATGYGYDVVRTMALVRSNFDVILMGNHDSACAGLEPALEVMMNPNYDLDRVQREELRQDDVDYIRHLPCEWQCTDFAASHGNFIRPKEWGYYIFTTETAIPNFFASEARLLFCGHTHHAAIWENTKKGLFQGNFEKELSVAAAKPDSLSFKCKAGSRYLVNVGSVGYPRNDYCSSYAIFDSGSNTVTIRRLPFDFMSYIANMNKMNMPIPKWLIRILKLAKMV